MQHLEQPKVSGFVWVFLPLHTKGLLKETGIPIRNIGLAIHKVCSEDFISMLICANQRTS